MKTTKNHVCDLQIALPCAFNGFCCFHFDLWETLARCAVQWLAWLPHFTSSSLPLFCAIILININVNYGMVSALFHYFNNRSGGDFSTHIVASFPRNFFNFVYSTFNTTIRCELEPSKLIMVLIIQPRKNCNTRGQEAINNIGNQPNLIRSFCVLILPFLRLQIACCISRFHSLHAI